MIRWGWHGGKGAAGLQEPQTTGHRNLSWKKRWHDSEGPRLSLRRPLPGRALLCSCGERCCIPRLPLRASCAPTTGPGKHQSGPCGALCPDVSSQQVLVSAWLGQTLDVTKGRENSHRAFSKPPAPAPSHHREAGLGPWGPHLPRRRPEACPVCANGRRTRSVVLLRGENGQKAQGQTEESLRRNARLQERRGWAGRNSSEASAGPNNRMWRTAMTEMEGLWALRWYVPQRGVVTSTLLSLYHR